jgi:hypothetical protein
MKAEPPRAWQPLTFGGVARYARAWIGWLLVTCVVVSLITAAAVVWTARRAWAPVVDEAISRLPVGAEIRGGRMQTPRPLRLAENAFLALHLGEGQAGSPSDIQVSLTQDEIQFRSLFGRSSMPYQPHWTLILSPAETEPWWNAWRPAVLGYIAIGTMLFLFASWIAVGIVYSFVPFAVSRLFGRGISLWGSWKLAVAALMPGAIFMSIAIVLYSSGTLRLAELLGAFVLHFVIGWIFLLGAVFRIPKKMENPFLEKESETANGNARGNPFAKKETGADPPPHE